MNLTVDQVLEFITENDVKFIRLAFCNLSGVQKNISIMAEELPHAFEKGITIDPASVEGFVGEEEMDVLLFPDPGTLAVLPWRPSHGRVVRFFCEMRRSDGSPYAGDSRQLLYRAVEKAALLGYTCNMGFECEFYLFELDENGVPTLTPQDRAGYCDVAPLDKGENVRREICLALEEMGIAPQSSHHERGPGQNEIVCRYTDAMGAADGFLSFRSVAQVVAARSGLHASFLPKPLPGQAGSSLHINLSLAKDGQNIFRSGPEHSPVAESFLAGILLHMRDLTLFLNPLKSSFERLGADVPGRLAWSHQNRSQLVRIPSASGQYTHMELRSPDPSLNPYLAFALLLEAGLDGVRQKLPLVHGQAGGQAPALPHNLEAAAELAAASSLVRSVIPQPALDCYLQGIARNK